MKRIFVLICVLLISVGLYFKYTQFKEEKNQNKILNQINQIEKKFHQYVKVVKNTNLYLKGNNQFEKVGIIGANNELELEKEKITENTKHFKIANSDYYVSIYDIEKIDALSEINTRYQKYIPFNENIITNDTTTFIDENGNFITYNDSYELPIIIKEEDKYGVEFNDKLYYVNKDNVKEIKQNTNSTEKIKDKIITLTYHFLYDPETDKCNQSICQSLEQFESHLKYIKDNNYLTLQMFELEMFLDKKINIPYNSLVITIDDGTIFNTKAIDLLEEYEQYATLFIISGWIENLDRFDSKYLALESHTDLMHKQYECKGMGLQGGGILCKDRDYVLNDLKTSQEKLGGSKYFAYPFFDHNQRAIELLKEAGFNLAFVGQYNTNGFSTPGKTDKYKVPRKTIFSSTSLNDFKSLLK